MLLEFFYRYELENVVAYSIIGDATPKIGEDICGTLRSQGGGGIVPPSVVSIAGNIIGRSPQNGGNGDGFDEEVCYTLTTADRHAVAFQTSYNNLSVKHEISQPILAAQGTTGNKGVNVCYVPTTADRHAVAANSIIRRLTPVECEKLQGFEPNYTKIPYRNKSADQCPDSPRYKALGNSMAVPVMAHIGKKIQEAFIKTGGM